MAARVLAHLADRVVTGRFDLRVVGPFAVALLCFLPRALPEPAPVPPPTALALPLPALHATAVPKSDQRFELDAERSSVRFLVHDGAGDLLVQCPAVTGQLHFGAGNDAGTLELRLDLASLRPVGDGPAAIDLVDLLGIHRGEDVSFRGALVATTTIDLPGVSQRTWLGNLRFGSRVVQQALQTWQCSLPGQPLRLQGHGTVAGAHYGLPPQSLLGLFAHSHDVTLGLDLAFRRRGR